MDWVAGFVFFGLPFTLFAVVPLRTLARAWGDRGSARWPAVGRRVTAVATGGDHLRSHQFSLQVQYRYTVEGEYIRGA